MHGLVYVVETKHCEQEYFEVAKSVVIMHLNRVEEYGQVLNFFCLKEVGIAENKNPYQQSYLKYLIFFEKSHVQNLIM